jgi:hypothetical protein
LFSERSAKASSWRMRMESLSTIRSDCLPYLFG